MIDLSFIRGDIHRRVVSATYENLCNDADVCGILLQGSVARGDAYPCSDVDVYVLLHDGLSRPFQSEYRDGILVEIKSADFGKATNQCTSNPMGIYQFLDSRILSDCEGKLQQLKDRAWDIFTTYRTPGGERQSIGYWLESALVKIQAARQAQDEPKASFVVATTSWKILEGIWAVNHKPVPPNGSVLFHLQDLTIGPEDWPETIKALVAGDTKERIDVAVTIIQWLLPRLTGA